MAAVVVIGLAGCQPTVTPTPVPDAVTGQNPGDVKYYPSDEPVKLGIQRFYEGNFGLSQQYFQNAVETLEDDADLERPVEQVFRLEQAHGVSSVLLCGAPSRRRSNPGSAGHAANKTSVGIDRAA